MNPKWHLEPSRRATRTACDYNPAERYEKEGFRQPKYENENKNKNRNLQILQDPEARISYKQVTCSPVMWQCQENTMEENLTVTCYHT